jgi:exosome complex RNA-binding protein Csl4
MDPHSREYAAAVRGMREIYRSDYRPSPGDTVLVERPFYGDIVRALVTETRGDLVTVDVDGEHLGYTVDEVTPTN